MTDSPSITMHIIKIQKQPFRGVLGKRCSCNKFTGEHMPKCDFSKNTSEWQLPKIKNRIAFKVRPNLILSF